MRSNIQINLISLGENKLGQLLISIQELPRIIESISAAYDLRKENTKGHLFIMNIRSFERISFPFDFKINPACKTNLQKGL